MNTQSNNTAVRGGLKMPAIEKRMKQRQRKIFKQNSRRGPVVYRGPGFHPLWCMCDKCLPSEPRQPQKPKRRDTFPIGVYLNGAMARNGILWANRDVLLRDYKLTIGDCADLEAN